MSFSLSEYMKIDVGWGFAPDPTGGAYSAPPSLLAGFKGPRMEGSTRRRGRGEGRGKGGMGREEKVEVGGIVPWLLGDRRPCL